MSIGGHQSGRMKTDDWLTPKYIIDDLGPFELDPCSPTNPPWPIANKFYTKIDNGLNKEWKGRVWCNPPYGLQAKKWLRKLADHNFGTALIFARTETEMFFESVWPKASAIFFIKGRLHFCNLKGTSAPANSGGPSCLISYGATDALRLQLTNLEGIYIDLRKMG